MNFKELAKTEMKRRSGLKSRINSSVNILLEKYHEEKLSFALFEREQTRLLKYLDSLDDLNTEISDVCDEKGLDSDDEACLSDIHNEQEYFSSVQEHLSNLSSSLAPQTSIQTDSSNSGSHDALVNAIEKLRSIPSKPHLPCPRFNGSDSDRLSFKDFFTQFNNSIDDSLSGSIKLTYLRNYLTGYAYQIISHLSISDEYYSVAVSLLKSEFLDEEYIVDEYFKKIINSSPKFDSDFEGLRQFLNESRASLYELKSHNVNLMEEETSGNKLISHIIFDKLPNIFKRELVHKVNSNYPSINQLFDNYQDIIKTLARTTNRRDSNKSNDAFKPNLKPKSFNTPSYRPQRSFSSKPYAAPEKQPASSAKSKPMPATLENFHTQTAKTAPFKSFCKFCNLEGHSMMHCTRVATHEARIEKCRDLNLCELCTSSKHSKQSCFGIQGKLSWECRICRRKSHVSALCPDYKPNSFNASPSHTNICINSGLQSQDFILPVMSVLAKRGRHQFKFNCLIDTGSQRSYVAPRVIQSLNIDTSNYNTVLYDVSTFLGERKKELTQLVLDVDLPGKSIAMPILVDSDFNLEFKVNAFGHAISNLKNLGFQLAADFDANSDLIKVDG